MTLARVGILRPQRPDRLARAGLALKRWGATPAAGYTAAAARYPDDPALIDEAGTLTFQAVHERSNALAHALAAEGVRPGDGVAIMCRNHRGWVLAYVATNKLGANALFMNTAFSGPQLADVARREDPRALIIDAEFAALLEEAGEGRPCFIAWDEPGAGHGHRTLDDLIHGGDGSDLPPAREQGKATILTSGTTGTPKGARRKQPQSLDPVAALLERIPLGARSRTMIAAPLFHSWGFTHFTLAMGLCSTIVLRRRFDPEATLSLTAQHRCEALVVVPVMLQRILELDDEVLGRYDLSALKAVPVSGSALPAALSNRWMDLFGDNLYNLYGSTEVAWATIATPADLRAAPGTAGRPPRGTVVKLFDEQDREVAPGRDGPHLRRQRAGVRGLHGRRQQGRPRRAAVVRRRRPLRRRRAPVRRRPRRRHDRLRRRERLPRRGRGPAGAATKRSPRRPSSASTTSSSASDSRRSWCCATEGALSDEEIKRFVKENLAGYKVPRDIEFAAELPRTSTGKVLKRELRDA